MRKFYSSFFATLAVAAAASLLFARPHAKELMLSHALEATGALKAGERVDRPVTLTANHVYSVSVALDNPGQLDPNAVVRFTVTDAQRELATKALHVGDADAYLLVRPTAEGEGHVTLATDRGETNGVGYGIVVREWPTETSGSEARSTIETEPNNTWQEATPMELGKTVFATCDDREFIAPLSNADRYPQPNDRRFSGMEARPSDKGVDWYKFTYEADRPLLVHFELDYRDREVPVDVSVFKASSDGIAEWKQGADPVSDPHEVQALPGNKFTTRVIERGTYYVKVTANHPVYQLRTYTYGVPPYDSLPIDEAARKAVRVAVDYAIAAGDSWHANTPRSGGVLTRVASTHAETQQCIACHPTHFTTRAQEVAIANGYPVRQRAALKFLTERLYNNPRPFYGHKGATWARMISASANVMSRLGYLLNLHEHNVTREFRTECLEGVAGYLKIYYRGRTELPPDESNGNAPLVSTYEVAGHSYLVFDELFRRTKNPEYASCRNQLRKLIEQDKLKDMRDLCYQTIDFAQIDPAAYSERLKHNCERILGQQRDSGQWAMTFNAKDPEAEFQTGHCLYTLALAGYSPEHPKIARAIHYLLSRQQPFGGWLDPLQSYENFKTPFRETQFAVMALAQFFPERSAGERAGASAGNGSRWSAGLAAQPTKLDLANPAAAIAQLDQLWDAPGREIMQQVLTATKHDEPLVKTAACEALGRVGDQSAVPALIAALGDRNKVVRDAAAWALRELATRQHVGLDEIAQAMRSKDEYTRRGAVRVFTQHFSYLTTREKAQADVPSLTGHCLNLTHALNDPDVFVRLYAAKALSQWFYWTDDPAAQAKIADVYLARMQIADHSWVRRAVLENFYSICDENIRYLYKNWVPLLAKSEDRDKVTVAQHGLMTMLAEKIAAALASGNPTQRDNVLLALTHFQLRKSADKQSYGEPIQTPAGLYARIGNDVEQIKFYEEATPMLEPALLKLLDDPAMRESVLIASFMLRDTGNLERLPLKMAEIIATDANARNRETAWEYYRFLPVVITTNNREQWIARLTGMMTGYRESRLAAFDTLARAGAKLQTDPNVEETFALYLRSKASSSWRPELLAALASMPKLHDRREALEFVQDALKSDDEPSLRSALLLMFNAPLLQRDPTTRVVFLTRLRGEDPQPRRLALDLANKTSSLLDNVQIVSLVADCLHDRDAAVQAAALAAVKKSKTLQQNPAVRLALPEAASGDEVDRVLDYDFFKAKVQPVFFNTTRGNCIKCHFNHNILQLHGRPEGKFTEGDSRANYLSALKVINLSEPARSLLLTKPTSDASSEGQVGATKVAHGGGVRWREGEQSEEYKTILAWIDSAKVSAAGGR